MQHGWPLASTVCFYMVIDGLKWPTIDLNVQWGYAPDGKIMLQTCGSKHDVLISYSVVTRIADNFFFYLPLHLFLFLLFWTTKWHLNRCMCCHVYFTLSSTSWYENANVQNTDARGVCVLYSCLFIPWIPINLHSFSPPGSSRRTLPLLLPISLHRLLLLILSIFLHLLCPTIITPAAPF